VGLIAEEIRSVWPYGMSYLILEFVDENTDAGEDDYDFTSAGQGIRSRPNRARRNVMAWALMEDMDGDLDTIKLKIPNFQGKNDPEAYLEWEKR